MFNRKTKETLLKFDKPAGWWGAKWREGLPLGNGSIGASVLGGAAEDSIMLTHAASVWQGTASVLRDVSDKLKDVRKLLDEGKYKEAQELYPNQMIKEGFRPQTPSPLPVCDFKIKMPVEKAVKEYSRMLNMETGEACVTYKDGATKFKRTMFVSRVHDYFVLEIVKSGNKLIDAEFSLEPHDKTCIRTYNNVPSKLPEGLKQVYESGFMCISQRNDNGEEFGAVARLISYGGTHDFTKESIRIKGTNSITVIVKLFNEIPKEKAWPNLKKELLAEKSPYDKLLKSHSQLQQKLMGSCELDLNVEKDIKDISVDDLLKNAYTEEADAALLEKMWYFGRYLLITGGSNAGSILYGKAGIWNGDYKSQSAPSLNGETQLLYHSALSNNFADFATPLFSFCENLDLKKNASRLFNCKGIVLPPVISPENGAPGSTDPKTLYFTAGAGYVAGVFYDYYLYTGDKKFLKDKAMKFMKEVCNFYEDFLKLGDDGKYKCYPSYSPEGCPGGNLYENEENKLCISKNNEVDFAVLRQLLSNLIEGAAISGEFKEDIAKWKDMLSKVPEVRITAGTVSESHSADLAANFKTGNMSHLYGAYPAGTQCDEITKKAYLNTIKKRITDGMATLKSPVLAYMAAAAAALGDGELSLDILNHIFKSCVMANLVTAENDWRDMGLTASDNWAQYNAAAAVMIPNIINSMIVSSTTTTLYVLKALPNILKQGSASGILTKCGCDIDVSWDYERKGIISLTIKALRSGTISIELPAEVKKIAKGPVTALDETKVLKDIILQAGKSVSFELKV